MKKCYLNLGGRGGGGSAVQQHPDWHKVITQPKATFPVQIKPGLQQQMSSESCCLLKAALKRALRRTYECSSLTVLHRKVDLCNIFRLCITFEQLLVLSRLFFFCITWLKLDLRNFRRRIDGHTLFLPDASLFSVVYYQQFLLLKKHTEISCWLNTKQPQSYATMRICCGM